MTQILTLISPVALDDSMLSRLRQTLAAQGATRQEEDWLAKSRALDVVIEGLDTRMITRITTAVIGEAPVDWLLQLPINRRKELLIADMDSTIVIGETLDELADHAGLKHEIAAITKRAMQGEIDFKNALRERVALLRGLDETALAATAAKIALIPGAKTLVATMRAKGAYAVLVSGGFDFFTSHIRALCGFDEDRANRLEILDGKLTGKVIEPILDRDAKLDHLRSFAIERGVSLPETIAVGDGANDLAMIEAAGLGVAFHGKRLLAEAADFRVDHNDLTALLFAQGYHENEFVIPD